jgi:uncharacterized membrane protein SpoIIM required for sporulation
MKISWSFWTKLSSRQKRIYSFLFILALIILVSVIGALVPTSPRESKDITNSVNQTVIDNKASGTLAASIFINNFLLCLLMFIPLVGSVIGFVLLFNTGYVIGAELRYEASTANVGTAAASIQPSTALLILVFALLTFACEYFSYAIGTSESIWLFRRLQQGRWRELKNTGLLIGLVAVLLTIGALVEAYSLYIG